MSGLQGKDPLGPQKDKLAGDIVKGGPSTRVPDELVNVRVGHADADDWPVVFRGDSRPPDLIFRRGFRARQSTGIRYRRKMQDIVPESAVCITRNFDAAGLFPLKDPAEAKKAREKKTKDFRQFRATFQIPSAFKPRKPPSDSSPAPAASQETPAHLELSPVGPRDDVVYIYILCALRRFNTYEFQQRFAKLEVPNKRRAEFDKLDLHAKLTLYAREAAVLSVPASDIIAAVKINRLWTGESFHAGGKYEILGLRINRVTHDHSLIPYQDVLEAMAGKWKHLARFLGGTLTLPQITTVQGLCGDLESIQEQLTSNRCRKEGNAPPTRPGHKRQLSK